MGIHYAPGGDWTVRAACAGMDIAMFFPESGTEDRPKHLRHVREVCADCPVQRECYEYAIETSSFGVWAGTTLKQRNARLREAS